MGSTDGLEQVEANDDVGISIVSGEEADAIIEVLTATLGDDLRVTDHNSYMKLETSVGQLEIRFDEVAEVLGRPFTANEFQIVFSTYYGRPTLYEERIVVSASMTAGVLD